jgi:predicted flap endonuclease-1-like 5' DNA nuclease
MDVQAWLWYVAAGFLLGWVMSTLTEWLWFRRRRMQSYQQPILSAESRSVSTLSHRKFSTEDDRRPQRNREENREGEFRPEQARAETQTEKRSRRSILSTEEERLEPTSRLAERVTSRRAVVETPSYPDPLWKIRGVLIPYQKRLYEAGIFTWHQLANTEPERLWKVTQAHANSDPGTWIEHARQLAEQQDRVGAIYTGPVPDDFTAIDGLGSHSEHQLYRTGIYTYAQLAKLTPEELARVLPEAGESVDFRIWLDQAEQLSSDD